MVFVRKKKIALRYFCNESFVDLGILEGKIKHEKKDRRVKKGISMYISEGGREREIMVDTSCQISE